MLDLTLNLDDEAARRLETRAARNNRSAAEEARLLIADGLAREAAPGPASEPLRPGESAWDVIQRIKARHGGGVDFEPLDRSEWQDRPVTFGD